MNLFKWAQMQAGALPELRLMFAIPNGGARPGVKVGKDGKKFSVTAARMKAEGVKRGVPDICLPVARGGYHGLFLELKAGKNSTSVEQGDWLLKLRTQGYLAMVVKDDWQEAKTVISDYLGGRYITDVGGRRSEVRGRKSATQGRGRGLNSMTPYVACFMFNEDLSRVALIRKMKPAWQKGLLNGIGGKVEDGESSQVAIAREFKEETGCELPADRFLKFLSMGDSLTFVVDFFALVGDLGALGSPEFEKTGELLEVEDVEAIHPKRRNMVENLPWLIALAVDFLEDGRPIFTDVTYPLPEGVGA